MTKHRPLHKIAAEIAAKWHNMSPHAKPYLNAMLSLNSIDENYGFDTAQSVVIYFLTNASTFRGDDAKRLKSELRSILASVGYKI